MKIALYVEDGLEQIVLTPETKTERSILGSLHDRVKAGANQVQIHRGEFYGCRGGWMRHGVSVTTAYNSQDERSTMIVLSDATSEPEVPE